MGGGKSGSPSETTKDDKDGKNIILDSLVSKNQNVYKIIAFPKLESDKDVASGSSADKSISSLARDSSTWIWRYGHESADETRYNKQFFDGHYSADEKELRHKRLFGFDASDSKDGVSVYSQPGSSAAVSAAKCPKTVPATSYGKNTNLPQNSQRLYSPHKNYTSPSKTDDTDLRRYSSIFNPSKTGLHQDRQKEHLFSSLTGPHSTYERKEKTFSRDYPSPFGVTSLSAPSKSTKEEKLYHDKPSGIPPPPVFSSTDSNRAKKYTLFGTSCREPTKSINEPTASDAASLFGSSPTDHRNGYNGQRQNTPLFGYSYTEPDKTEEKKQTVVFIPETGPIKEERSFARSVFSCDGSNLKPSQSDSQPTPVGAKGASKPIKHFGLTTDPEVKTTADAATSVPSKSLISSIYDSVRDESEKPVVDIKKSSKDVAVETDSAASRSSDRMSSNEEADLFSSSSTTQSSYQPGMAPPFYADLGKKANDVFSKGYHFGLIKLDLKTKSENGVEFSSGIVNNQESGKVFGSLQSKYAVKDYGLTFTEKWNTDNTLATDITLADKIAVGLKVTLEGTFAPQTGSKTGKLKSSYVTDLAAFNVNADLDLNGPIVDAAAVLHHQGWLAGVFTQFDTQKTKFSKNNFALGYQSKDFALHTNVDNGKDFGGSIYQKVSDKLECGVSMKWSAGSSDTLFGVGSKFLLDSDASLHAKINNKSLIGLGYQQKLRQGVTLTLSAAIDGQNFNAGGHKIGLALELEP